MKQRWAVAVKDFTFRGRAYAAGEVFQERSELVGIFIFQKKAKHSAAPVPETWPEPVLEPLPPLEPEPIAAPVAETPEPIPDVQSSVFFGDEPELPVTSDIQEGDIQHGSVVERAPAKRVYQRRVKPVTE